MHLLDEVKPIYWLLMLTVVFFLVLFFMPMLWEMNLVTVQWVWKFFTSFLPAVRLFYFYFLEYYTAFVILNPAILSYCYVQFYLLVWQQVELIMVRILYKNINIWVICSVPYVYNYWNFYFHTPTSFPRLCSVLWWSPCSHDSWIKSCNFFPFRCNWIYTFNHTYSWYLFL